jgi:N-acetylglucosamine-6-phosphate deacetylase
MTFAPELERAQEICKFLSRHKVQPALGHSQATVREAQRFMQDAPMHMTHLFNAMSPISHKNPGLSMLPFLSTEIFFELNADGVHVADECIQMCYDSLNLDRCILITDAVVSAGESYGAYRYYGRAIQSSDRGVRYTEGDTLIGSNCLIPQVVKKFIECTGCSIPGAIRLATLVPSELLGLAEHQGSIEVGKEADLVIWDQEWNCIQNLRKPKTKRTKGTGSDSSNE